MGDWIKRAVMLALVGAAAWKAWGVYKGRGESHQVVFRVEGPPLCQVQIRYEAGEAVRSERTTLEWQSEALTARGSDDVALTVDVPLSCGWQPSQVRCAIDRDGAPWKQGEAARVDDTRDGSLASYRCSVESR